jgi:curved DNA-binding protein CbpA
VKTYYEMLDVAPAASVDEIKRAFRREIAKYHPDKVQHLGKEFQEIAAIKAAELTQAYKTLSDETLRAEYDAQVAGGDPAPAHQAPPAAPAQADVPPPRPDAAAARPAPERPPAAEPASASAASVFSQDRAGASDLVRKATVMRFRQALVSEFGSFEEAPLQGFEITCIPKPPFWKFKLPPRILGRFADYVDAAALAESWAAASRMKADKQRDLCVFLMAPKLAPARDLATAIGEAKRKPMPAGGKLIMIPVNTVNWAAHIPTDAPDVVKSLLTRLKTG